jgi:hypothetical protein
MYTIKGRKVSCCCLKVRDHHRLPGYLFQLANWMQGMYEYGVEYGIIQDGEIPEVQLRGEIMSIPLTMPSQQVSRSIGTP